MESRCEIFLVFGVNVEGTSSSVKRYLNFVCKQIVDEKGCIFQINGLHVPFHFEKLPYDIMSATLGEELSNILLHLFQHLQM